MEPNIDPIKRAFDLARSGKYRTPSMVVEAVKAEGYHAQTLTGRTLMKQLRDAIAHQAGNESPR